MTALLSPIFGDYVGEFYALACAVLWAIAIILFRQSGRQLGPFALNLFKNVLAMVLLVPTIVFAHGLGWPTLTTFQWALLLFSGFIGIGLADTLFFQALNSIGASRTAVGSTLLTPMVIALSFAFLGERLNTWQFLGAIITLLGVTLVNYRRSHPLQAEPVASGFWLLMAAMLMMAVGIVITKPILAQAEFLWVVEIRIVGGVVGMVLMATARQRWPVVTAEFRAARQWPLLIVASFIGAYVAMLFWLAGYKYADASVAAVLNESSAVFVIFMAAVFLKERMTSLQWLGSLIAIGGVLTVVFS